MHQRTVRRGALPAHRDPVGAVQTGTDPPAQRGHAGHAGRRLEDPQHHQTDLGRFAQVREVHGERPGDLFRERTTRDRQ